MLTTHLLTTGMAGKAELAGKQIVKTNEQTAGLGTGGEATLVGGSKAVRN